MLSNMTEQEFETEKDMLRGNLGRMCVSDDKRKSSRCTALPANGWNGSICIIATGSIRRKLFSNMNNTSSWKWDSGMNDRY